MTTTTMTVETLDALYDTVGDVAASLHPHTSPTERDAEAFLLDAMHLISKASDALAGGAR
jgi:hypothetical protein